MTELNLVTPAKLRSHTQESQMQFTKKNVLKTRCDEAFGLTSNQGFNNQLSITEQEILSHGLIAQVIQKSKKKTVQHNVNRISTETKLYISPQQYDEHEFDFDTIPPKNKDFVSTASEKVGQINRRLSQSKKLADRLTQMAEKNKQFYTRQRNQRAMSADNVNKRVSISGLVTYNFTSINARRSLGSIPNEPQEVQIAKRIEESKRRTSNSLDRQARIIRRRPNVDNLHRSQIGNAAVCDFHMPTDKFLKIMRRQSQKDQKIYGQKMEKLTCIKEYMEKEKADYEHSKFIIETVLNSQKKKPQVRKTVKPHRIDDDEEMAKRRQVYKKRRVMMKHLFFTEL